MVSAVSKAEERLGIRVPDELLAKAKMLTSRKMEAKGLPPDYEELLLEDVIVETCIMAAINGRYQECVQSA